MKAHAVIILTAAVAAACLGVAWHAAAAAAVPIPDNPPIFSYWRAGSGSHPASARALAVGADGALWVAGDRWRTGHGADITLARLADAPDGWERTIDGGHGGDVAADVVVSSDSAVYVVGTSRNAHRRTDILVACYTQSGDRMWLHRWGDSGTSDFAACCAAVDGAGRLTVAGTRTPASGLSGRASLVLLKYARGGGRLWSASYQLPSHQYLRLGEMALDEHGGAYVAGTADFRGTTAYRGLLVRYSGGGARLWARWYRPVGDTGAEFAAVGLRPNGGVYVCGDRQEPLVPGSRTRGMVLAYTAAGARSTVATYDFGADTVAWLRDLAVAADGDIVVTGMFPTAGNDSFAVLRLSPGGVTEWTFQDSGALSGNRGDEVAIDGAGDVLATGVIANSTEGALTPATYRISGAGVPLWRDLYAGAEDSLEMNDIATWGTSSAWVCCSARSAPGARYKQLVLGYALNAAP